MADASWRIARRSSSFDWSFREVRSGFEPDERVVKIERPPRGRRRQSERLRMRSLGQLCVIHSDRRIR